jgi:hypothetical protein
LQRGALAAGHGEPSRRSGERAIGGFRPLGKPFSCGPSNIHATHWHAR